MSRTQGGAPRPLTVLVVDDEPAIRAIVAALLEEEGYHVKHAGDGLAAMREVEADGIDLILSDVRMPRLDGATMAWILRQRGYDLPVILMSAAYADVDLPGIRFVPKPFTLDSLLRAVSAAFATQK